jgi:DNA mismatch repair protein MLH3
VLHRLQCPGLTDQRAQNIRVSSEGRRIEGFISLHGAISQVSLWPIYRFRPDLLQNSQHLCESAFEVAFRSTDVQDVNHFPLDRSEIHAAIAKRFASSRFSRMTQDDIETPDVSCGRSSPKHHGECWLISSGQKRSPRRLERYPIYVLDVTLPFEDVDVAYDPKKRLLGHRVSYRSSVSRGLGLIDRISTR